MFLLRFPDTGEVYCWGHGKKGQCGILTDGKPQLKYTAPVKGWIFVFCILNNCFIDLY